MKNLYAKKYLFTAMVCLALTAILFSACNKKGKEILWDYSLSLPDYELINPVTPGDVLFSGKEWTGKKSSRDAKGKTVDQSDIYAINKIDYHTTGTVVFDSVEKALRSAKTYDRSVSPYYTLLTGENDPWQLAVYQNESTAKSAGVLNNFFKTDYDMDTAPVYAGENKVSTYSEAYYGGFKEVTLPASWQTQGFDFPIYSNYTYPWGGAYGNDSLSVPLAPTELNPIGFYRRYFDVDNYDANRRYYISFTGVESAFYLYVNGFEVGYAEDSFDAADFDLTPFLNSDGKNNLLAVKVYRWCDGSYFENQDFLRLGGIFRDVYLYSSEAVRIADYTVVTDLDDDFKGATLDVSVKIENTTRTDFSEKTFGIDAKLFDKNGNEVKTSSPRSDLIAIASGSSYTVNVKTVVSSPDLWSPETPTLYYLVLTLYDKDGHYYGSVSARVGFRELSFTQTEGTIPNESYQNVLLNGKPLVLKGVNRHETDPNTGRYISHELCRTDIEIMKSLNVNAVRTCHYPNDEYFYDMCDLYGILVLAECNIESHYGVDPNATNKYFEELLNDRILSGTTLHKNHPSVIIWSVGNETNAASPVYPQMIAALKQRDKTRMVHFESLGKNGGVDVDSTMYSSVYDVYSKGLASDNMPYLICEYAHAMGNSVGNLYEYWEVIRGSDNLLGGFIWDFVDQAMWTPIPDGGYDYYGNGKYLAYGGCWEDDPNSGDFCANGIISADRTLQPECAEVKYVYQSIWFEKTTLTASNKTLSVYNEYAFTDLSFFDFEYELTDNGITSTSGKFSVSCAPLSSTNVEIPFALPSAPKANSTYKLTVCAKLKEDTLWGKKGDVVASEQFDILAVVPSARPDRSGTETISVTENQDVVTLQNQTFTMVFSKETASLTSYVVNGQTLVTSAEPSYTRGKTSNDNARLTLDDAYIKEAVYIEYSTENGVVTVHTKTALSVENCYQYIDYTVYGNGEFTVTATLELSTSVSELYRYATVLTMPKDFENVTYLGNGEADTYSDRLRGSHTGVYTQTVSDGFFPYVNPQDTGNKTGVEYIALTSSAKNVGLLVVCNGLEASALHYTAADLNGARYTYLLGQTTATYLTVGLGSRGTGGASCGPGPLSKYRMTNDGRDFVFSYTVVPYDKNENVNEIARVYLETEEYDQERIDAEMAAYASDLISASVSDKTKTQRARKTYDALTAGQKALVGNYQTLLDLESGKNLTLYAKDSSPEQNDSPITSGTVVQDNSSPTGYALKGHFTVTKNDYLDRLFSGRNDFTVSAVVKFDDFDSNNVVLAKGDNQVALKTNSNGDIEFFVYDGSWHAVTASRFEMGISVGKWCMLTAVRDGDYLKLYANGRLVKTAYASVSVSSASSSFGIGIDADNNRYLRGSIASAQVFDRALSADEISSEYSSLFSDSHVSSLLPENSVLWFDLSKAQSK